MLCEQAREHLSAYLDKELSADLSAAVRSHLDTCPDCRRLFEGLRATADLLARLPVRAAPEGLAGDVMREMQRRSILGSPETAAGQPHERTLAIRRARSWPRALAVAATLLLAAGIGLFAYLGGRPVSPAPSVELGLRSPEKTPDATAAKAGDRLAVPAGATELARERGGFGGVATAKSTRKKLATPDSGAAVTGTVARTDEKLVEHGAARARLSGPAMVQQVMNYVAEGQAPVEELKAVATRGNLDLAENQLVVRAASRDEANKELVGLFGANGWEVLPQEEASAYLRDGRTVTEADGDEVNALGVAGTAALARKSARRRAAAGWYFRAGRNGEDTWVILTDRDNLSRFGGQLAQARVMTVGADSSKQFRAIERLQQQLRAQAVVKADVSGPAGDRARSRPWGKDAERMARQRGDVFRSSAADAGRGVKRPAEGGTLVAKPPVTRTDDEQDARRPKPADAPEAAIPETPAIAMHERPPTGWKKAPAGPATGLAAVTPAKPSVSTPVEPPAPAAKPSISALAKPAAPPPAPAPAPVMKGKPAARWRFEEEDAPADTAVVLRGADERRAGLRKAGILKERAKAEGNGKRRSFAGYAGYKEADELEKAGAMKRKPAKPTVTFGIAAGGLRLHRVLVLPKNQVLLVVRVRQAAQGAEAAVKPVAAEEGQRSVGEK